MKTSPSNERYLRPTFLCDPYQPEIIAMAYELGAHKLPDQEFAENVFKFVNGKIRIDFSPQKLQVNASNGGMGPA